MSFPNSPVYVPIRELTTRRPLTKPTFFEKPEDAKTFVGYGLLTLVFLALFLHFYFNVYQPSKQYDNEWTTSQCYVQNLYNQTFFPRCPFNDAYSHICFQWNIDYTIEPNLFNVTKLLQIKDPELIQNVFLYLQPTSTVACKYNIRNQDSCIILLDECDSRIKTTGMIVSAILLGTFGGCWILFAIVLLCIYCEQTKKWLEKSNSSSQSNVNDIDQFSL